MTVKDGEFNQHFVCTYEEARRIVEDKTEFFVSKCGCREGKGTCQRSSHEVCLTFQESALASTQDKRRIGIDEILRILSEAAGKRLVPRPFRDPYDRESVVGICLCCDDCCAYFTGCDSGCDKGSLIERTELDQCTQCGQCVSWRLCTDALKSGSILSGWPLLPLLVVGDSSGSSTCSSMGFRTGSGIGCGHGYLLGSG